MTRKRVNQKKCATVPVKRAATAETAAAPPKRAAIATETAAAPPKRAVADSTCGMCGSTSPRCSCGGGAEAGAK